ncbi:MAG: hypothetical protein JO341_10865 [Gammaproteobacteria bacterium]|nr:hypothetical protein [Gammaproteobacteria bacterium]MBV9621510.1 hypothetical protein [Gammaproteobacteria bacterium]
MLAQQILVAVLVLACALYSTWRLLGARTRLALLEALARRPGFAHAGWLARWRARAALAPGCAGCAPNAVSPKRTPDALRR